MWVLMNFLSPYIEEKELDKSDNNEHTPSAIASVSSLANHNTVKSDEFKELEKEEHDIQNNIASDESFYSCSLTDKSDSMKETNETVQDEDSDQLITDELNVKFSSKINFRVFFCGAKLF